MDKVCAEIASLGYKGIEIAPFTLNLDPRKLTLDEATQAGKTIADAGLSCVGLHWILSHPKGMHITTSNDEVRAETTEFAPAEPSPIPSEDVKTEPISKPTV